jgi:hypothetical protein
VFLENTFWLTGSPILKAKEKFHEADTNTLRKPSKEQ